ncbi:hypothetical protein COBT_003744, partial [Conglomerata obtusa]
MNKLRKITNYTSENLDTYIKKAVFATNISFCRAINTLPFYAHFGHVPIFKNNRKLGAIKPSIIEKTAGNLTNNKKEIHDQIRIFSDKYKKTYEKNQSKDNNLTV